MRHRVPFSFSALISTTPIRNSYFHIPLLTKALHRTTTLTLPGSSGTSGDMGDMGANGSNERNEGADAVV